MDDVPLIPMRVLGGNPTYSSAKVSPDGRFISYLKPSADKDVLNVWIRPRSAGPEEEVMVTADTHRGIRLFSWAEDSQYILYLQDKDGDEDWHLYAQALDGSPARELTPFKGVRVGELLTSHQYPDQVLVALNLRDSKVFDVHRLSLATGELKLDTENPGDVLNWLPDADFVIRAALSMNPADGSKTLRVRDSLQSPWRDVITWSQDEEASIVGFNKDGSGIYLTSSLGRDTTELQLVSTSSTPGAVEVLSRLASSPKCDVGQVLVDPLSRLPQAVTFSYLRQTWQALEPSLAADFEVLLGAAAAADLTVESRSTDGSVWLVSYVKDDGPQAFHVYDRSQKAAAAGGGSGQLSFLFVNRPALSSYKLGRRHPVLVTARDGLQLPSYLTLPPISSAPPSLLPEQGPGSAASLAASGGLSGLRLPLVLAVHGGPWARDIWGLDTTAQWLANRGYAVLQVNYRGSSGFGKNFLHLGDKQWGVGTMQHDLTDAVQWAVASGIADPAKVAIYGGSYGGYACLAGLAFTPDLFCCGVDVVGPSHIKTLLQSIPPYWAPLKRQLIDRIGDPENDDEVNKRISPLFHVQAISAPLIIAQGANDPRVKKAESDQIYSAMRAKGLEVEYFLYTDEGHGLARPPNRLDFMSRMDVFLARHLGGRSEPPLSELQGAAVVAMHALASLDDWRPEGSSALTAGSSSSEAAAAAPALGLSAMAAAGAAAAAAVGAAVAAVRSKGAGAKKGEMSVGQKVGLAVGVPAVVLTAAAALVVVVLRGLSPRR